MVIYNDFILDYIDEHDILLSDDENLDKHCLQLPNRAAQ